MWAVAFSRDGILASGSSDCTAKLWNVSEKKEIGTLNASERKPIRALAYAPDGKVVAVAKEDNVIRLHDADTGAILQNLRGHEDVVTCLAFSGAGAMLASGSRDKTVKVWDGATGKPLHTLTGHAGPVHAVAFTRDGKASPSAGAEKIIHLWKPAEGKKRDRVQGTYGSHSRPGVCSRWPNAGQRRRRQGRSCCSIG